MTFDLRELSRVRSAVLLVTAAAWALLVSWPVHGGHAAQAAHTAQAAHAAQAVRATNHHAPAPAPAPAPAASSAWGAASASASASAVASISMSSAAYWPVMLIAMMAPALILPIHYIRQRSFTHRRARAVALFVAAYAAIWCGFGVVFFGARASVLSPMPAPAIAAAAALLIAFIWQCSPLKQRCLNRCHFHPELSAFGAAADLDVLRFGATHGLWCAGSCWALMLVPFMLPAALPIAHLPAMAVVTILIFSERLERPHAPAWRLRGLAKALRIIRVQTRLRLGTHLRVLQG